MTTSLPPPAQSSGNGRFIAIGLVLALGAGGVIVATLRKPEAPPDATPSATATATASATARIEPTAPTVGVEFNLASDTPDAGAAEPSASASGAPRIRYVYRTLPACPGTVDGPAVSRTVSANYGGLRECYNRALRGDPNLRGAVTAEWIINANGSVGDVSVRGSIARNNQFKTCFQQTLARIRFPAPRGGCAQFQQAFNFTAGGG